MTLEEIRDAIQRVNNTDLRSTPDALEGFCTLIIEQHVGDAEAVAERTWAYEQLITLRRAEGRTARASRLFRQYLRDCAPAADADYDALYQAGLERASMGVTPLRRRDRFYSLTQLFGKTLHLEGLMAECGCFRGLSSFILCSTLKHVDAAFAGKDYRIFDSFEGLSPPQAEDAVTGIDSESERVRINTVPGRFAASLEVVKRTLVDFPAIAWYPGWIPSAFPNEPNARYRFVHVDVDIYQPTRDSFEYFYPKLVSGGIIVSDDFNWPGARKAIEDFCAKNQLTLNITPYTQDQTLTTQPDGASHHTASTSLRSQRPAHRAS
jgi:hypothetical protein